MHEKKRGLLPKGRERSAQRNDAQCSNVSDPRKATGETAPQNDPSKVASPFAKGPRALSSRHRRKMLGSGRASTAFGHEIALNFR